MATILPIGKRGVIKRYAMVVYGGLGRDNFPVQNPWGGWCHSRHRHGCRLGFPEDEGDGHGDWLAASVQSFQTLPQLKEALREIVATGETIAVQGTNHFERLANELGLCRLASEWGTV